MAQYQLRWAQLDVARQMESIDFIKDFINLLADSGYNGLLLYLEDRIRTASYTLPAPNECYSIEEIKEVIAFAATRNVEVIPCVATLGHAERFLRHKELEHLAELQGDMKGRFEGTQKLTFCVTHPEFYDFIGRYLEEVAEIFPSNWFHIGLDEFWDYNLCARCKKAMPDSLSEQKMFLKHILRIRDILAKKGKRVMMWSDMFEFYADVYQDVPQDVVMVDWQYQRDVRSYHGHLLDVGVEDRLAVNAANGHETIVAPADRMLWNSQSYFDYADGRPGVIGGLMTCWEKTDTFLYHTLPMFVAGGFQMNGMNRDEAFAQAMQLLFNTDDPVFCAAVHAVQDIHMLRHFGGTGEGAVFNRDYFGLKTANITAVRSLKAILANSRPENLSELANRCVDDMLVCLDDRIISYGLQEAAQDIFTMGCSPERLAKFTGFRKQYSAMLDNMEAKFTEYRPGVTPNVFTVKRGNIEKRLLSEEEKLSTGNWLAVSGCLPDGFGVQQLKVEYQSADGAWQEAGCGVWKPIDEFTALFTQYLPLPANAEAPVKAIRLTSWGLGGMGLTFVEAKINGKRYVPQAIGSIQGRVGEPEWLLQEDTTFAWFGGKSTRNDYFDPHAAVVRHGITLLMKEFSADDIVFAKNKN